jgi:hypothetical protein
MKLCAPQRRAGGQAIIFERLRERLGLFAKV